MHILSGLEGFELFGRFRMAGNEFTFSGMHPWQMVHASNVHDFDKHFGAQEPVRLDDEDPNKARMAAK